MRSRWDTLEDAEARRSVGICGAPPQRRRGVTDGPRAKTMLKARIAAEAAYCLASQTGPLLLVCPRATLRSQLVQVREGRRDVALVLRLLELLDEAQGAHPRAPGRANAAGRHQETRS